MTPTVSVVIPCYRQGHLLSQAVDSALAQSYPRVEVVVVNDGSDDNTEAVARGYAGRVVYVAKPNGGLSSARNAGLRAAAGEYVLFLDADDLLHPEAVGWLVPAARAGGGAAVMGYRPFAGDPGSGAGRAVLPRGTGFLPRLFRHNYPVHAHLCPAAAVARAGGFAEDLPAHEDWDLWFRVAADGVPLARVGRVGALYRRTPGSMSADRARMATSLGVVAGRVARRFGAAPALLGRWGHEVLRLLYAARRRVRAAGGRGTPLDAGLTADILALRARGARVRAPLPVAVQDRLPPRAGDWLEAAGLAVARAVLPGPAG